jgi:hypothetical protein
MANRTHAGSANKFPATGKLTGNFAESGLHRDFDIQSANEFNGF